MRVFIAFLLFCVLFPGVARAADIRYPVAAGLFYPAKPAALKAKVEDLLDGAERRLRSERTDFPKAILVPDGSLFMSGDVAAAGYVTLKKIRPFVRRVVILSSSGGKKSFGVLLSGAKKWEIPGAVFDVDVETVEELSQAQGIGVDDDALTGDKSIETQLAFVASVFGTNVRILPVMIEDAGKEQIADLIDAVWGGAETVIIAVSGFAENKDFDAAGRETEKTADKVAAFPDKGLKSPEVSAPLVVNGLTAYAKETGMRAETLDVKAGEWQKNGKYEGYAAIGFYENTDSFKSNDDEFERLVRSHQSDLLRIAAQSVVNGFERGRSLRVLKNRYPQDFQQNAATAVNLYYDGALRGSASSTEAAKPLLEDIADNAYNAAFSDFRFVPLEQSQLKDAEITISILTRPQRIKFSDEDDLLSKINAGTDGLILRERSNKALFLPQVWETFRTPKEFFSHLKRNAGLSADYWSPTVKVWRFKAIDLASGDLEDPSSVWEKKK